MDCFWVFSGILCNFRDGELFTEVSGGHLAVRTFQLLAHLLDLLVGVCRETVFLRRTACVGQLTEIDFFRGNHAPAGSLQKVQAFVHGNFAEPGFLIRAVEMGEVFVGGQEDLLCQILCVEGVADRFQAY